MTKYTGEIAALGTSFCWSFGSIFFTIASRLIGSSEVNRIRLVLGMLLLMFTHLSITGTLIPLNARFHHWFWLGMSGIVGFAIGDTLLFRGYVLIGPRLTMLLMSLAPVLGALLGWFVLGEFLSLKELIGIIVTIFGISVVLYSRNEQKSHKKIYSTGILCGLGASLCQALGYFLSKKGLAYYDLSALSGNVIRIMSGALAIWVIALSQGRVSSTISGLGNGKAVLAMIGGAIFGPFLGVWLSLVAIQHSYIGIASTLMALPPVILIPLSRWIFKEHITKYAVVGTIVAIIGVGLIFID
ncbi:MAG: DMT family transporter [candidate division WOR-3 bacterium]|nr:DMT family transporter [candidate division WOR-3 bacterium]